MNDDFWKWYDAWKKEFYVSEDNSLEEFTLIWKLIDELDDIRSNRNTGN